MKRRLLQSAVILTALAVFFAMCLCSCQGTASAPLSRSLSIQPDGTKTETIQPYESPFRRAQAAYISSLQP